MVVNSAIGEELDVVWLLLRVQVVLKEQVTSRRIGHTSLGEAEGWRCEGVLGVKPLRCETVTLLSCLGLMVHFFNFFQKVDGVFL